jgi:CRP/FNR family transcriptional regulator, dissimilatory nitrate respiration regulator
MIFESINRCPVLRGVSPVDLEQIFKEIHYNIKAFDKDVHIMAEGEKCNHLMILIEGEVRGEMTDFSGTSVKIEDIQAPRPIAPAFLFGEKNQSPVTIISNVATQILFIPKDEVIKLFQKNAVVLENYLNIVSSRGQFLSQKVKLLSLKSLKQKIAFFLMEQKNQTAKPRTTQQEMAEILGVTRPALARTLGQMEEESIISYTRGEIKILNEKELSRIIVNN